MRRIHLCSDIDKKLVKNFNSGDTERICISLFFMHNDFKISEGGCLQSSSYVIYICTRVKMSLC